MIGDAGGGVWFLDVSNPTNPILLSHILNGGVDHSVYIENDILFVAEGDELIIIDKELITSTNGLYSLLTIFGVLILTSIVINKKKSR